MSGLRLAQRQENAFAVVNAGMSVKFEDGTDTIKNLQMFYGSVGSTVVSASQTCQQLIGRYVTAHLDMKHSTLYFNILMKIALGEFFSDYIHIT